jgi:hypothetical protein
MSSKELTLHVIHLQTYFQCLPHMCRRRRQRRSADMKATDGVNEVVDS